MEERKAKVSVIIPVYNVEKYLRQCLDSVVNQTLKDIEIICVNDGSTDGSFTILEEYAAKDNRIKVINLEKNEGLGNARNVGIQQVKSDYVMFLDSDDWLEPNACEIVYNHIKRNDNDFVIFNFNFYFEDQNPPKSCNYDRFNGFLTQKDINHINPANLDKPFIMSAEAWYKIYKVKFLQQNNIKFLSGYAFEDQTFLTEVFCNAKDISVINIPLVNYRQRSCSITRNASNWKDYIYAVQKAISLIPKDAPEVVKDILILSKIASLLYWFKTYKSMDNNIKNEFYTQIHNNLNLCDKDSLERTKKYYDYKLVNKILKYKYYKLYKCDIILSKILNTQNVFSIKNTPDRKHKVITILGFKIKVNRYGILKIFYKRIKNNKIVFSNYFGKSYGCNPKYITEEILKRNLPYEIVWLVNEPEEEKQNFPQSVRLVKYYSINALKELLSAKVWVDNTRKPYFWDKGLKKNPKTKYIQTWHGSLGMKKIEAAIKEEYPYWRSNAKIDSKNIDYLLTTSETDKKFMRQSFWYDGEILVSGYPRNDVLYSDDTNKQAIKEKVYDSLEIDRNSKFILYVPTFRDDGRTTCFSLDYERILKTFEEKYNCSIVLGTRFHPSNFDFANKLITYSERIINATIYPDIMELLIAADVVITDYSSCIFDFMHLKRPAFIFATDIEQYEKERGFYFPLEDTPFPIAQNNDELVENINNFDYPAYQNEIVKYMQKNGYADDGHASERIVDLIEKIIRER